MSDNSSLHGAGRNALLGDEVPVNYILKHFVDSC